MATRLTPDQILHIWEVGDGLDPLARAIEIWHAASGLPRDELEAAPIGARDGALIDSRIATLGPTAAAYVCCPSCDGELEFDVDLADLRLDAPSPSHSPSQSPTPSPSQSPSHSPSAATIHVLQHEGWHVEFRLPDTGDLRAAAQADDPRHHLLAACVTTAECDGEARSADDAARALDAALDAAMTELDPQADLAMVLDCAMCGHGWSVRFDIGAYYWRELVTEARRVLADVHRLARAYSWSEADVLALSPTRRRAYLEMTGTA